MEKLQQSQLYAVCLLLTIQSVMGWEYLGQDEDIYWISILAFGILLVIFMCVCCTSKVDPFLSPIHPYVPRNGLYIAEPNITYPGIPDGGLTPGEAFSIDSKIDDGRASSTGLIGASTGDFRSVASSFIDGGWSPANSCLDTNGNYSSTSKLQGCTSSFALR